MYLLECKRLAAHLYLTDISEEHVASIIRAEKEISTNSSGKRSVFISVNFSVYFSTLKMEATYHSETSVDFQRTTQHYNPEEEHIIFTPVRATYIILIKYN
jgi:hypothetical protein